MLRARSLLVLSLGVASAAACLVPTFDVGPTPNANGGSGAGGASGGVASGGKTSAQAGSGGTKQSGGGTGAGNPAGGTEPNAAGAGSGPGPGAAGEGGEGGGIIPPGNAPTRSGFSVFHDSASGNDNASSSSADATFDKPSSLLPGDFMLVFFGADHSLQNLDQAHLALSGWKLHDQHANYGTDGQATYLLYKFAGAAEPSPIVFAGINPAGSGDGVQGLLSVYRGVNVTEPINAYMSLVVQTGTTTTKHIVTPTPAVTTTVNDCLLIAGLSPDTAVDAPTVSSWPSGFDINRLSIVNPVNPNPYGWANIYTADRVVPKAGTVAASAFGWDMTYGGMDYFGSLAFVLALAPAP
jgi:hypothetical protein